MASTLMLVPLVAAAALFMENMDATVIATDMKSEAMKRAEVSRPAPHPSVWKVNEKDQPWVQEKFTAQPIGVAFTPIRLTGARDRVPKKTYVRATGYDNPNFEKAYAKVKADPSWRTFEMPCGHEVMIDMPERTAELLLSAA